jgi:hemolysin activation/secretion protein
MKPHLAKLIAVTGMTATLCLGLASRSADAQQPAAEPASPGQLEKRIEETVTEQQRRPERLNAPAQSLPARTSEQPESAPTIAFTLAAVSITGASVFTPAELAPLYEDFLATRITDAEASEIARRITKKYTDAGYIL